MDKLTLTVISVTVFIGLILLLIGVLIFKKEPGYGALFSAIGLVTSIGILLMSTV